MRIAQLGARNVPAKHGGLEVVVESLSEELAKSHEVIVFVSEGVGRGGAKVVTTAALKGKYTHTASQLLTSYFRASRGELDLIHIHGVGPSFVLLLDRKRRTPVVVTAHGIDWERAKWPPVAQYIFRTVATAALKRATAVSAVSRSSAEALSEFIGRPVTVIENAADLPPETSVEDLDLPERFSLVLSRLTPEKGVDTVIRAYGTDVEERLGPLLIAGGGGASYADGYERELRHLADGKVRFLGPLDRSRAVSVLRKASLLISASHLEAQPMSVIEAHSLSVPLVLSDIAAHREIAGDDAVYFDERDPDALNATLLTPAVGKVGNSATSRWASREWRRVAREYEDWYREQVELG